jgi:hypothetical protein
MHGGGVLTITYQINQAKPPITATADAARRSQMRNLSTGLRALPSAAAPAAETAQRPSRRDRSREVPGHQGHRSAKPWHAS